MPRCYRSWTAGERAFLAAHYARHSPGWWPARRIAAHLGRTQWQVKAAAARFGLHGLRRGKPLPARMLLAITALYALGLDDGAIAVQAGCARHAVRRWRGRTGRPTNKGPGGRKAREEEA